MKCQRKEVAPQAKYLLCTHGAVLAILLIILGTTLAGDDDSNKIRFGFFATLTGLPLITLGLAKIIARFKVNFVDLFGIFYLLGYVVALSLTNWIEIGQQLKN